MVNIKIMKNSRKTKQSTAAPAVVVSTSGGSTSSTRRRARKSKRIRNRLSALGANGGNSLSLGGRLSQAYVNTLHDPFQYPAIHLGFNSLIGTGLITTFVRGSFAASSDSSGCAALIAFPTLGNSTLALPIYLVGGSITPSATFATTPANTTPVGYTNNALAVSLTLEPRLVSLGLRAYPSIAATVAPGQCAYGSLPPTNMFGISGNSVNSLFSNPWATLCPGTVGAVTTSRPADMDSFTYQQSYLTEPVQTPSIYSSTSLSLHSIPFIAFTGLPASSTIIYEVVANWEYIPRVTGAMADAPTAPALSDYFPSVESMWSTVRSKLDHVGRAGVDNLNTKDSVDMDTDRSYFPGFANTAITAASAYVMHRFAGRTLGGTRAMAQIPIHSGVFPPPD